MSKMPCKCGHVISDVVCPCPTEADVIGHIAYERFDEDFTQKVEAFLKAIREGRREEWIATNFSEVYPGNQSDADIISDIVSSSFHAQALCMAECENCGRLWLQRGVELNEYRSFVPDEGGFQRHLARTSPDSQDD